ncbi:hypothetical protein TW86_04085 [Halomonas sp. S2151]|uniref:PhoH family protein n=1 Tax=Halomonas sp. S2151 TaxID=579478 RepID=UPI0005FA564B|nr:PhoH family protein [Halomonas sp. S2151]KJZ17439.1 hypothetical protein TW86_04085 [Halomonas sp. S2151]
MPRNTRKQQKRKERRAEKRNRYQEQQSMHPRVQAGDASMNELLRFVADAKTKAIREPIEAQSEAQGHYLISIEQNDVTFGTGPAGTGKTFISTAMAVEAFLNGEVGKIVVTRPVIEADGDQMGFLPGEIADKFAPYFYPVREVLEERLGAAFTKKLIEEGKIEIAPFAYMRGRTFKNAFVILDEAQNTTPKQMKLFLTRLGENVRVVINGDSSQQDIRAARNGLDDAHQRFSRTPGFGAVAFETGDVRRSPLAKRIVENYERDPDYPACA